MSHRREQQARLAASQQRVTLVAIGVLVAAAIITAVGVVWGVILPPRAHIITVGDERFDALAVEKRAEFLVAGSSQLQEEPVTAAVNMIRRDETLLQLGAAEAGDISGDDMTKAIRKRLGVADDASAEDYAKKYESFLKGSSLDKATFERLVRAQVISDRMAKKFESQVGATGLLLHPMGIGSRDQTKLKQLRDAVAGGADFQAKAIELGLATKPEPLDFGWIVPPDKGFLKDNQIEKLQAGQMSEIITRDGGIQYELYRMAERDEKATYTDAHKAAIGASKVDEWVTQQSDKLKVTEDVSDSERKWLLKRVTAAAQKLAAERSKAAGAATSIPVGGK